MSGGTREIIRKISDIRSINNRLWMRLLDIAVTHAPDEAKKVLREINANDRQLSDYLGKLAQ